MSLVIRRTTVARVSDSAARFELEFRIKDYVSRDEM